jgi:IS605 OrfB family transposase
VANYCVSNNIGTLVIGLNKRWKDGANMGKVNNQKFVSIPHSILIEQIKYKCYVLGVKVIVREESYTSKASALDGDFIPTHGDKVIPNFSGRRVKRGLYKSPQGLLNADVNAALNMLRKETGEALNALACRGCVFQPVLVTLGLPKVTCTKRKADSLPLEA